MFQEKYFSESFDPAFEVVPRGELKNAPLVVRPATISRFPSTGKPLSGEALQQFIRETAREIAALLGLDTR